MNTLKNWLRKLVLGAVALVLLFEEWGWEPLASMFAWLAKLPLWSWLERQLRQLPPWGALLAFGAPVLLLLPVKLGALYLFSQGHYKSGVLLLVGAKLVGTALVARLFQLTEPSLMQLAWFARWYPRWKAWKNQLLARARQSNAWRQAQQVKAKLKETWHHLRG